MELLLNLAWLLLALPAYWLFRRGADSRVARRVSSLQCLLALGCAVVLLFPVISATDDLHAMSSEMEESASSKRTVRQASNDKASAAAHRLQSPPAAIASVERLPAPEAGSFEGLFARALPRPWAGTLHAGRSPPVSLLG